MPEQKPIVVVSGLPRSGTSMMMKMLQAGGMELFTDGERKPDVDNPQGYFEALRVKSLWKETDKSYLQAARGKAIKVISFLVKDLPLDNHYKIIFMQRDMDEVIQSQDKMIHRMGIDSAIKSRIKLAYRNDIMRTLALCRRLPNIDLLELQYGEVIDTPLGRARRVNGFVGGSLDAEAMARVVDKTLYRNRV